MYYIDIYKNFIKNKEYIKEVLKENSIYKELEIEEVEITTEDDFPYIIIKSNTDQKIAAAMIGINIDCGKYDIKDFTKDVFYLPLIMIPLKMKDKLKDYGINFEQTIIHEKLHVKRILYWINEEPKYIENFLNFGFDFINKKHKLKVEILENSINFEVRKIFYLEEEALTSDFKSGENLISMPSFFGGTLEYKCQTLEEFLLWQLTNYITNLKEKYIEEFREEKESINKYFSIYVNKYGLSTLGEDAYKKIIKHNSEYVHKMLDYSIKKMGEEGF